MLLSVPVSYSGGLFDQYQKVIVINSRKVLVYYCPSLITCASSICLESTSQMHNSDTNDDSFLINVSQIVVKHVIN